MSKAQTVDTPGPSRDRAEKEIAAEIRKFEIIFGEETLDGGNL